MTTNFSMTCDVFADQVMAYLEGDADAPTRQAIDAHAARCAPCGELLADLRRIEADAARLPRLAPARDLWQGIAARIDTPVIPLDASNVRRSAAAVRPARRQATWLRPIAAAAGLVVATAGITYSVMRHGMDAPRTSTPQQVAVAPTTQQVATASPSAQPATVPEPTASAPAPTTTPTPASQPALRAPQPATARLVSMKAVQTSVDLTYDREIARLRFVVEQRRAMLDSTTLAVIEKNLKIIDTAIAQCREALARDPNSRFLLDNLNSTLDTKVQLLRTAAMLPARS